MELILIIVAVIVFFVIFYFVTKEAVRNGIIEARHIDNKSDNFVEEETRISQTVCPNCGEKHDIDYPLCPYCKYRYTGGD